MILCLHQSRWNASTRVSRRMFARDWISPKLRVFLAIIGKQIARCCNQAHPSQKMLNDAEASMFQAASDVIGRPVPLTCQFPLARELVPSTPVTRIRKANLFQARKMGLLGPGEAGRNEIWALLQTRKFFVSHYKPLRPWINRL